MTKALLKSHAVVGCDFFVEQEVLIATQPPRYVRCATRESGAPFHDLEPRVADLPVFNIVGIVAQGR